MAPLIGITGEQKPATSLVDVLDVLRETDIDVYYPDYAKAVLMAGGMPVWIPADAPVAILDRLDGLLLSGGDDIDPAAYGQEPHPALGSPSLARDAQERTLLDAALGADIPIQRCQVHKARNITERVDPKLHAAVRRALRQAWELEDADKAERLLRNLARRLELDAPGVSASCWRSKA